MLQALRDHFEQTQEIPKKDKWKGPPSFSTIIRTFGSWSGALEQAGINKNAIRKGKLIAEMRKTVAELGGVLPSANDWGRLHYKPSSTFLTQIFGSWNEAVVAAGFTPKAENKTSVKEEDIIAAFKKFVEQHGTRPKVDEWRDNDLQPSYPEIITVYGTWDDALRSVDLNVNATKDECLQALRSFEEAKRYSPSVREWNEGNHWPSSSQIIRMFGSWNEAWKISRQMSSKDEKVVDLDQKDEFVDELNNEEKTFDFSVFRPEIYKPYLNHPKLFTIKEFVHELKLPIEDFLVDEYWNAWNVSNKFCAVDKGLLDYLGYEGTYKHQREAALKNLRSNFRVGKDFVYESRIDATSILGAEKQPERVKVLAISYSCLLQWQMNVNTARSNEIRRQAVAQQILYKLYLEYQTEWRQRQLSNAVNQLSEISENDEKHGDEKHDDETDKNTVQLTNCELVLSSGDKYLIPVRQDGFVDLTSLAKAGHHRLDHYMESEKTAALIRALSSHPEIRGVKIVQVSRVGKTQRTFGHRLLAYNYAQHISPDFAAQVCIWLDNLFLTGSVTLRKEKSVSELDSIWKEKYKELRIKNRTLKAENEVKDEKIKNLSRDNTQLKIRNEKLKMKRSHPQLEEGFCIYCHHDDERAQTDRFKIGKTKDMNGVLKSARRNAPHTLLDFIMYLDEDDYSLIESNMKKKFKEQRKPRSHELFNEELETLRKGAMDICDVINVSYRFAESDVIDAYNQFITEETSAGEEDIGTQADDESSDEKVTDEPKSEDEKCDLRIQACENMQINTANNVNVNIRVNLSELKDLLKDLESFTNKKLDSFLDNYDIPKHGNKAKKIEKLRTYINEKLSSKSACSN